jgi:hypothetical protein
MQDRWTPFEVIAAAFRAGPGEPRLGDETPGEVARDVILALLAGGYRIVRIRPTISDLTAGADERRLNPGVPDDLDALRLRSYLSE